MLRNLGERGLLEQFPAVVVACAKASSTETPRTDSDRERYREDQAAAALRPLAEFDPYDAMPTLRTRTTPTRSWSRCLHWLSPAAQDLLRIEPAPCGFLAALQISSPIPHDQRHTASDSWRQRDTPMTEQHRSVLPGGLECMDHVAAIGVRQAHVHHNDVQGGWGEHSQRLGPVCAITARCSAYSSERRSTRRIAESSSQTPTVSTRHSSLPHAENLQTRPGSS
jgi:hypothetical protein